MSVRRSGGLAASGAAALALLVCSCARACGGEPAPIADAGLDGAADAGDAKAAPAKPKVVVPEEARGTWHLPSKHAAIDLELHEDTVLVWRHADCVCSGGGCGRWIEAHGAIEVRADGDWRLYWPIGLDAKNQPKSVEVRAVHLSIKGDELRATFDAVADAAVVPEQIWRRGGVCPKCKPAFPGPLPAGDPIACAPEFMFCPLSNSSGYACH